MLVSICMPAYNAAKYITETIASILAQTYTDFELIIVNDGSTDNTGEILAGVKDPRVKVIPLKNSGQCAAANLAYQASKGELIKFMDADDLISPEFIEHQVKKIGNRKDAVASSAWGRFYNDDISTFTLIEEKVGRDLPGHKWLVQAWGNANPMMQCARWLIPRSVLDRSGLWDESLSLINDLDFFTRVLLSCNEVLFEGKSILYYRSGIQGSLSDTKSARSMQSAFNSIDKATKNLSRVRTDKAARLSCANMWQQLVYELYPKHPELTESAKQHVMDFGGSNLPFPAGGYTKIMVGIGGWKLTKIVKSFFNYR